LSSLKNTYINLMAVLQWVISCWSDIGNGIKL